MSAGIEKLKSIGIQKIHEDTHLARAHIEAIFQENYDAMNGVQYNGFLSILEKEYDVDLSELKAKAKEHFGYVAKYMKPQKSTQVFQRDNRKKNMKFFYAVLGIVLFLLFAFLSTKEQEVTLPQEQLPIVPSTPQETPVVSPVQQNLDEKLEDENSSVVAEHNDTQAVSQNNSATLVQEPLQPKEQQQESLQKLLTITPKSKVWIGYIDLQTGEKFQKTSMDALVLDGSKDWLLSVGHGNVTIEIGDTLYDPQTRQSVRFVYQQGELKKINAQEYKSFNGGNVW